MSAVRFAPRLIAALIVVAAWSLAPVGPADVTAAEGQAIDGRVAIAGTSTGVAAATVLLCASADVGCTTVATATSGSDGTFALAAVSDGTYRLFVRPPTPNPLGLLEGWYAEGAPDHLVFPPADATPLAVAGADLTGLEIGLPVGHRISGRVTFFGTDAPVPGVAVIADECATGDVLGGVDLPACVDRWLPLPTWSSVTTGEDGSFTTGLLADGSYQLTVNGGGVRPGWYVAAATRHYTTDPTDASRISVSGGDVSGLEIVATSVTPHAIGGRITVAGTDTPVPGARISLGETVEHCYHPDQPDCVPVIVARSGSDGTYRTPPLTDGSYLLRVDPPETNPLDLVHAWYAPDASDGATPTFSFREVTVAASDATGVDLGLPVGHRIRGRITVEATGAPVVGAQLTVRPCTSVKCWYVGTAVTSSTGDYVTNLLPDGTYVLEVAVDDPVEGLGQAWYTDANPSHFAPSEWVAGSITVAGADTTGDIALWGRHTVAGRVTVAGSGTAVAGAQVSICDPIAHWYCSETTATSTGDYTTVVWSGAYVITVATPDPDPLGVTGGWYSASSADGYAASASDATRVVVVADVTGIDVALPGNHVVAGRITAAGSGLGVADAHVQLCSPLTWAVCIPDGGEAWSTSSGEFSIPNVPTGSYDLLAYVTRENPYDVLPGWYSASTDGNYTAGHSGATTLHVDGDITALTLTLPVGHRISGRITEATTGLPIAGALVSVDGCDPGVPFCMNVKATVRRDSEVTTDTNGYYRTDPLPDGSYRWRVGSPAEPDLLGGWYSATGPTHVTPDESTSTRIVLSGTDVTGVDARLAPRPCETCEPTGGTTGDTIGSASGGGWQGLAGGRATFGFSVESVATSDGTPVVTGHLTWHQQGRWRFTGTLDHFRTAGGVTTASGTGRLEAWRVTRGRGRWIAATTAGATVTILVTAGGATRSGGSTGGAFGIAFAGTRASGAPTLPAFPMTPLAGGSIAVR